MTNKKRSARKQAIARIDSVLPDSGEKIKFFLLVDDKKVKEMPEEEVKTQIQEMLKNVKTDQAIHITGLNPVYSYEDIEAIRKQFDYGNTFVELNMPYCLHVPNDYFFEINLKNKKIKALVVFRKIWTDKAQGSSEVDIFSENKTTYFQKGTILTPQMPQKEELGYELKYTGKNVEKEKDYTGYFRYTKAIIQFDTSYTSKEINSQSEKIRMEIEEVALEIINKFLDVYRFISKEEHVIRLGSLTVTNIVFLDSNQAFMGTPMGHGIRGAIMNISKKKIDKIKKMLSTGKNPPLYKLLFLNAHASLSNKRYQLAVLESFQALEIYLENFLIKEYKKLGFTDKQIHNKLNQTWRTKERLKDCLKEVKGKSLNEKQDLWDKWCTNYDKIRNEVIHKGKEPSELKTTSVVDINEEVVAWIKSL